MAKRNKPWNPAKEQRPEDFSEQLGFPNKERLRHSKAGFDPEQVAIGHRQHGRVRSRERAMLTHPSLLADRIAAATQSYIEAGEELPKEVRAQETPSDRAVALHRNLLWSYLITRRQVVVGERKGTNYEASSRSSDTNRLPLTDGQFNRRAFYEWLRKQPGWRYFTANFLDKIAAQVDPQASDDPDHIMSKAELGMWLIDCDSPRDGKNAADGALAAIVHGLADAAAMYAALERQKKKQS